MTSRSGRVIAASRPPPRWLRLAPWAIAALAAVVAATTLWFSNLTTRSSAGPVRRLAIELPDGERLALARTTPAGLSRGARDFTRWDQVVYAGRRLHVRRLDEFTARGCPYGRSLRAWSLQMAGGLRLSAATGLKVPSGGDPLVLCEAQDAMALGWRAWNSAARSVHSEACRCEPRRGNPEADRHGRHAGSSASVATRCSWREGWPITRTGR